MTLDVLDLVTCGFRAVVLQVKQITTIAKYVVRQFVVGVPTATVQPIVIAK